MTTLEITPSEINRAYEFNDEFNDEIVRDSDSGAAPRFTVSLWNR